MTEDSKRIKIKRRVRITVMMAQNFLVLESITFPFILFPFSSLRYHKKLISPFDISKSLYVKSLYTLFRNLYISILQLLGGISIIGKLHEYVIRAH